MNVGRSALKLFLSNVSVGLLSFFAIAIFARQLPQSELGVFFLFQALLGMIAMVSNFGIREATEKRVSEGSFQDDFLASALALKAALIIPTAFVILLSRDVINGYLGADLAIFLIIVLVFEEIFQISLKIINAELRVGETALLRFVRQVLWLLISESLLLAGFGVKSLIYGLAASFAIVGTWGWIKKTTSIGRPTLAKARSLVAYSRYGFILSAGGFIYNWTDVLVLGFFLTQSAVSSYEIAWRVSLIVILLSRAIGTTMFPQVSQWDANDAKSRIEDLLARSITPSLLLAIPAFFGTIVFSREILAFVFRPAYQDAWLVLTILMFNTVIQSIHAVLGKVLPAINRPDLAARATFISVMLNLVLNVGLVWQFGLIGAAVATVSSALVGGYLHVGYVDELLSVRVPTRELGWLSLAAVVMTLILISVRQVVSIKSLHVLLLAVGFGATVYFTVLYTIPSMRRQLLEIVFSIRP